MEKQAILIQTIDKYNFLLIDKAQTTTGVLQYNVKGYTHANIAVHEDQFYALKKQTAFNSIFSIVKEGAEVGNIEIATSNSIILQFGNKFTFRKLGFWKIRFVLFDKNKQEVLAILPVISWKKRSYTFNLQINDEMNEKINNLLILLALHCTIYSLVMMYGGTY